jgi:very-short-patch-repair endonuclease
MVKSNYYKSFKKFTKKLRTNSIHGEIILWTKVLRNRHMYDLQFNRQFAIDKYVVDFIYLKIKLIVEIDGYSHQFKFEADIERDNFF